MDVTQDRAYRNRTIKVRRSTLIVPANVPKFLTKAFDRKADAVQLDLEDGVPYANKDEARSAVRELLQEGTARGAELNVRINNDAAWWKLDLDAVVYPGLNSITLPKCEDAEFIHAVDHELDRLELERGLVAGSTEISVLIESAEGIERIDTLLGASRRISTVTLGNEDFCHDLGIEASDTGEELFPFYARVILHAKIHGVMPLGMVASIGDYHDLARFRTLAQKSRQLGFMGSSCIHPDQVKILNEVYTPSSDEIAHAHAIVAVYEEGLAVRRGSCSLNGKMVDPPVYWRARHLLKRFTAISERS